MSIIIGPTKIKESFYLLVPRSIVDLMDMKDSTKLSLNIKQKGKKHILQYVIDEK